MFKKKINSILKRTLIYFKNITIFNVYNMKKNQRNYQLNNLMLPKLYSFGDMNLSYKL